jgi:hypothetical protein
LWFGVDAFGCDLVTPGKIAVVPRDPTVPLYRKWPVGQPPRFDEGHPVECSEFSREITRKDVSTIWTIASKFRF